MVEILQINKRRAAGLVYAFWSDLANAAKLYEIDVELTHRNH